MIEQKNKREQVIRDAKSNIILDAARRVFALKGFHETRLEEIAFEAGFSKASLYNYYDDKDIIFLSLAIRDFDELFTKMKDNINPEMSFVVNLERMLQVLLTFFGDNMAFYLTALNYRTMCQMGSEKFKEHHEKLVIRFKDEFARIFEAFTDVIRYARLRGEIQTDIDEKTAALYVTSLIRGLIFEWKIHGTMNDKIEPEIQLIVSFVCNGLGVHAPKLK